MRRMLTPTVRPWYGRRKHDAGVSPQPPDPEIEGMVVVDSEAVVVDGEVVVNTE